MSGTNDYVQIKNRRTDVGANNFAEIKNRRTDVGDKRFCADQESAQRFRAQTILQRLRIAAPTYGTNDFVQIKNRRADVVYKRLCTDKESVSSSVTARAVEIVRHRIFTPCHLLQWRRLEFVAVSNFAAVTAAANRLFICINNSGATA